jgi:hypothetical protein
MFKSIRKALGGKKKKKKQSTPKLAAGEGIRQFAAILPEPETPAPKPVARIADPAPSPQAAASGESAEQLDPRELAAATRKSLIDEAMRIRAEKAKELEKIPAKDRAKLRRLAEKMMGAESEDEPDSSSGSPGSGRQTRH